MKRKFCQVHKFFLKIFMYAVIFSTLFHFPALPQCKTNQQVGAQLINVEKDQALSTRERLLKVIALKKIFEKCGLNKDSVYAKLLHRIGAIQYSAGKFDEAIRYTLRSININISGKKESNRRFVINTYFNLGFYYQQLHFYNEALDNFDKCIAIGNTYNDSLIIDRTVKARIKKGNIYYQRGDYQKDVEEMNIGIKSAFSIKDTPIIVDLLHERAQAQIALKRVSDALIDAQKSFSFIRKNDYATYANNYKIRAQIYEANDDYTQAIAYHKKVIINRSKTGDTGVLAGDYNDAASTLIVAKNYSDAKIFLKLSLMLAQKAGNYVTAAKASSNLGRVSLKSHSFSVALTNYHVSLIHIIPTYKNNNELDNPTYIQCNTTSNKNFLSLLLTRKTECLLNLYKQSKNKQYLFSALKTARLTDSIITDVRYEQTGEQSKLYWRNETREFFTNAIEACYQAGDGKQAFFFMEKSRAVLLNDKLNELGAFAYLPAQEAQKEQTMQINVLSLQQQLAQLAETDPAFEDQQVKLLQAKEDFDNYVKTLQNKYPAYYQYKYADEVPDPGVLQKYLRKNNQSFVHYFITDTIVYLLGITGSSVKFIKCNGKQFNEKLFRFLQICSDKQALNNNYPSFAALSNNIYNALFKPLQLPAGKVIICYDNFLIPFEALTKDNNGKDFLINNYTFSYVYSARFLLKKFNNPRGNGNFLGVAPVSYAGYLKVPTLMQSETTLDASASFFNSFTLIANTEANRSNFLKMLPHYTIVTVLSHARADSTDKEPVLFMADSVIRLSELQLLRKPSTKLIVLSACQTNVGKIATGEGIISLARGFAAAGIPCISATLWKADEKAIYSITESFLQNIAAGMRKDDALQQAKLAFMQNGSNERLLPFYWANMILAGNGEPVNLSRSNHLVAWITGIILIAAISLLLIVFARKRLRKIY